MLKRKHLFTKSLWQIFLYLFELLSVSFGITYLTDYIEPISSYMTFIERMLMAYSIYQILVVVILTNLNDIKKDSYLAWLTVLKMSLLYVDTKEEKIKECIIKMINYQLERGTFNSNEFRKAYFKLRDNLDSLNRTYVEIEIIIAEEQYEVVTLNWRFSFILRKFK